MVRKHLGGGNTMLGVLAGIAILSLLASSSPLRSFAIGGNDNYQLIPANSTIQVDQVHISSDIAASNGYSTDLGCDVSSQWSYQYNILNPGYSWIQTLVQVNPSGNSCFSIEYWPSQLDNLPDYYSFLIGYTGDFENSGNTVSFEIDAQSWQVNDFTVTVPHDEWIIYPYQLDNSPTISYSSNSASEMVMVGCCGGATAHFTGGTGSITYYDVNTLGTDGTQMDSENSNMGYGGLSYVTTNTWDQTFSG